MFYSVTLDFRIQADIIPRSMSSRTFVLPRRLRVEQDFYRLSHPLLTRPFRMGAMDRNVYSLSPSSKFPSATSPVFLVWETRGDW